MDIGQKLDARSAYVRHAHLAPYGGWLGYVVILISDLLGIWEILLLTLFLVLSWVVLRSATMEIALILGLAFDCAIPLQYWNDPAGGSTYRIRLSEYWTTFLIGMAVEAGAYALLHPDLFTMVVAMKTLICTWIWIAKGVKPLPAGSFNVTATSSTNRDTATKPPPAKTDTSSRSSGESSGGKPTSSAKTPEDPKLKWWIEMDESLERMGYAGRGGRCGMIEAYMAMPGQDQKDNLWKKWTNIDSEDKPQYCASYKAKLEANRLATLKPLPDETRFGNIYKRLADYYPDPLVRWAMMYKLRGWKESKDAENTLNKWLTEPNEIRRRTAQYRQIGLDKGALKTKLSQPPRPNPAPPSNPAPQSNEPQPVSLLSQIGRVPQPTSNNGRAAQSDGSRETNSASTQNREAEAAAQAARQKRIMDNFQLTVEHYPEAFGEVSMAYIDMAVDGHPVQALVDSGARISVLSGAFARKAGLHDLIDTRWATVAHGVGSAQIIGRIHSVPITVGGVHRVSTFYVIEGFRDEVLLGIDFFKRYRCITDHAQDGLRFEDTFVPFVPAAELNRAARERAAQLGKGNGSGGQLFIRPESLKKYTKKLVKGGYPEDVVPAMLDDMTAQPTAEAMQACMNIFVNATANSARQNEVIQHYRKKKKR